jgi:N-acetylmuramoyl-L-alanine amidase
MRITFPRRLLSFSLATVLATVVMLLGAATSDAATPDYPGASWVPASSANYSVADRTHDYPIDMIVIHDIEGTAASAISAFQDPSRQASAHYVVDYNGAITQMVQEKDIAWHAGNWDYNTRSIGIEHAGYACCNYYTTAEYDASAHLIASICSRYGVPMDRTHVIGHYQVPDPNNPGLYGGSDHHTDPGSYWNWTYYMSQAQKFAAALPSPPHMLLELSAVPGNGSVSLTWPAARTCRTPIDHYHISGQPGNIALDVAGSATSASIPNLDNGLNYTFTVTAINADGSDSLSASVSPYTTPGPPTNLVATPADGSAVVTWTAPSDDGGRTVTAYMVTAVPNGQAAMKPITFTSTSTMQVIIGLQNGVTYTFVVQAINLRGVGASSSSSNAVTPSSALHSAPFQSSPAPAPSPTSGATQSSPAPPPPGR